MKTISNSLFNDGKVTYLDFHRGGSSRQLTVATLRVSSARRIEQLRALVAELMMRDIGYVGVATLLQCSKSAARMYVQELRGAGMITARPIRQPADCVDKLAYRLHSDPQQVQAFLAKLSQSQRCNITSQRNGGQKVEASSNVRRFHIMQDDANISLMVSEAPAQRDPLVTALFGSPGLMKKNVVKKIAGS